MNPPAININSWITFITLVLTAIVTISIVGVKAYFTIRTEADNQRATYEANHLKIAQQVSYVQGKQEVIQDYTKSQSRQIAQVRDYAQALAIATPRANAPGVVSTLPTVHSTPLEPYTNSFATGSSPASTGKAGEPPFEDTGEYSG